MAVANGRSNPAYAVGPTTSLSVRPYVPTLRVATPIAGVEGGLFGILVLNIDANAVLAPLTDQLPSLFTAYLINRNGDYLLNPDPSFCYGFDKGTPHRWQDDFVPDGSLSASGDDDQTATLDRYIGPGGQRVYLRRQMVPVAGRDPDFLLLVFKASVIDYRVATARNIVLFSLLSLAGTGCGMFALYASRQRSLERVSAEQC
jgi:hypothetical protein